MVKTLGDIRILVAEVLMSVVEMDVNCFTGEGCNCIHDSTFHILMIWTMEKSHNNVFLVKMLTFLATFLRKSSNITLMNAFIKTNMLADLSNFATTKLLIPDRTIKDSCGFFYNRFFELVELAFERSDCKQFAAEVKKSLNWKFLHTAWLNQWSELPEMTIEPKPRKVASPVTKKNTDSLGKTGTLHFEAQTGGPPPVTLPKSLLVLNPILAATEKQTHTKAVSTTGQVGQKGDTGMLKSPSVNKFARLPPPPSWKDKGKATGKSREKQGKV